MKKPIFIAPVVYSFMEKHEKQKVSIYAQADHKFWTGSFFVSNPRYGTWDNNPVWDFAIPDRAIGPDLSNTTNLSFEEVTDQRAHEFKSIINQTGKRVVLFWSGGIDSTVVLAALIKNLSPTELAMVDIVMTNESYYENPLFFEKFIRNSKFNIIDFYEMNSRFQNDSTLLNSCIITDGVPADKLWVVERILHYAAIHGPRVLTESYKTSKSELINFAASYMGNAINAEHFVDLVFNNIEETNAPIETVADFFYWINFNYHWIGHIYMYYANTLAGDPANLSLYNTASMPWYETHDYQRWSFSQQAVTARNITNMRDYKMLAKQYIYSLDKNNYYMMLRTKTGSPTKAFGQDKISPIFQSTAALFDDGTIVRSHKEGDVRNFIDQYCLRLKRD